ncbi:MAG: hypothetical protein PHF37_05735 [Phycisphaerae bacterium]|nr:hypothetical protein [Phycisphaerae bacterium]
MKAIVTGKNDFRPIDDNSFSIEADKIQLIPDEPEKREVRDGDCGIIADHIAVVNAGIDLLNGSIEPVRPIRYQSAATHLFNLLDLVTEMGKAKDGRTETIGGVSAHIYNRNYIMFAGMSFSKADAFTLGCQLIGLSQGVEK